jgi:hypothetical protein
MTATNTTPNLTLVSHNDPVTQDNQQSIEYAASSVLKQLGIRPKFTGFGYLKTAIVLCCEDPDEYSSLVTKRLYPAVAKTYHVNNAGVERAIRSAISGIKCSDMTKEKILGYTSDSYTNKEVISSIVEYIRYL